jgi:DNA (cytosine-5)-methyltransferase 1
MFLENVKHILKIDDGNAFTHICRRINEVGYVIKPETMLFELSPHQFGIPQIRERVVFCCIREDIYDPLRDFMEVPKPTEINWDIMEKNVDIKYKINDEIIQLFNAWDEMIKIVEVGTSLSPTILCHEFNKTYTETEWNSFPDWKREYITKNRPLYEKYKTDWDVWYIKHRDILSKKEIYGKLEWQAGKKIENDSIWNYFIQMRQSGIRVKKANYFPTLVAIVQTPIYAKEQRYITPRECARLQSFPDTFILHCNDQVAYKQFGNSVNVDVIYFVISKVLDAYNCL